MPLLTYIMLLAVLSAGWTPSASSTSSSCSPAAGPGTATQTIQILNYRAFGLGHMGEANAIGLVTLVLVALMCWVLMRAILRPQRGAGG